MAQGVTGGSVTLGKGFCCDTARDVVSQTLAHAVTDETTHLYMKVKLLINSFIEKLIEKLQQKSDNYIRRRSNAQHKCWDIKL